MLYSNNKYSFIGRATAFLLSGVLLISSLTGCQNEVNNSSESSEAASYEATSSEVTSSETNSTQSTDDSKPKQPKDEIRAIAEERISKDIESAIRYVEQDLDKDGSTVSYPFEEVVPEYSKLTDAQKQLYDDMLSKVQSLTPFVYPAEEYGYDVLDDVFAASEALNYDHPECEIYFTIDEIFDGETTVALKSSYYFPYDSKSQNTKDTTSLKKELDIFDMECNLIVEAIPEYFSTYDKYRYLAALISIRTTYDDFSTGGNKTKTAYGAIQGNVAICQGYARAFEYLCKKANLWCKHIVGISRETAHSWNLVKLESGTYHVDVTWADSDMNEILDEGWHYYFMITQDEILSRDHEIIDDTVATGTPLR